ncbi:MAG TPA: hypothetical protein VFU21_28110 [Kofleriaceae bacterium]|nr:hypothetical protein [Kofleriaceae bacterium]
MDTRALRLASLAIAVASAGCEDFATPAELDRPQILAIASDPASVAPGERARLSLLVAGPDGAVTPEQVSWSISATPGVPELGRVERDGDDTFYVAPAEVDDDPTGTLLQADVTAGGAELTGVKAMVVTELELENPVVAAIERDGVAVAGLRVVRGAVFEIAVRLEPEATDDVEIAWYSTSLTIEKYRSQPTEVVVEQEAEDGWLFAVARDRGGVGWLGIPVDVED